MTKKYDWNQVNEALIRSGFSNIRILEVIGKLPGGKSEFSWEEINHALVCCGISNRAIMNIIKHI